MRVSIVATSLDGQQPESKSVINMVHRIQNRNPGYSDFSNLNMSESFNNIQATSSAPISDGATALKLEEEVNLNNDNNLNETQYSENINESDLSNGHSITENLQETTITENHHVEAQESKVEEPSNGLENFGLQEEGSFELFDNTDEKQSSLQQDEKETEEDELEIPAFLRRQKN